MPKYPFKTSCPSCYNKTKYYWYHSKCGGFINIWNDGYLECQRCFQTGFILDWLFDCRNHGESTFLGPNTQRFLRALSSLSEVNMPMETVFDILEKIRIRAGI